jgi:hypothetical protein
LNASLEIEVDVVDVGLDIGEIIKDGFQLIDAITDGNEVALEVRAVLGLGQKPSNLLEVVYALDDMVASMADQYFHNIVFVCDYSDV